MQENFEDLKYVIMPMFNYTILFASFVLSYSFFLHFVLLRKQRSLHAYQGLLNNKEGSFCCLINFELSGGKIPLVKA